MAENRENDPPVSNENKDDNSSSTMATSGNDSSVGGQGNAAKSGSGLSTGGPLTEKDPNALKPELAANFLSLEVSFITNLPDIVVQKITARANEFEAVKSQKMLDEVNYGKLLPPPSLYVLSYANLFFYIYISRTNNS